LKDFRNLKVWTKAHRLSLGIYKATRSFPREERFGLTGQMRRSAVSVPANIAEGCGRSGDPEFARVLQIAMGSASELEYHLLLAHDLGFMKGPNYSQLAEEVVQVKQMLAALIHRLKADR